MRSLVGLMKRSFIDLPAAAEWCRSCSSQGTSTSAPAESQSTAKRIKPPGWLGQAPKQKPKTGKEKRPFGSWLWSRRGPDGQPQGMQTWEKVYWGIGVTGVSMWLFSRGSMVMHKEEDTSVAEAQAALTARREDMVRAMVAGKSFLEDDSVFEGMSPKEIQALAAAALAARTAASEARGGSAAALTIDDPFDGMSPEEIDAYVDKHGINALPASMR